MADERAETGSARGQQAEDGGEQAAKGHEVSREQVNEQAADGQVGEKQGGATTAGGRGFWHKRLLGDGWWVLIMAVAVAELAGISLVRSRVAPISDWEAAADFVRENYRPLDAMAAAPNWADATLRQVLGERISLSDAGRSDLASHERLWGLSIRGALPVEAPDRAPELTRIFGRVRVSRWDLGPSAVVYDLVQQVDKARVGMVRDGFEYPCAFERGFVDGGGGLGKGAVPPANRFVCDPRRRWLYVAPVVLEDLDLKPRYCVWQHPQGPEPVRVTFSDVPLGDSIVLYGGLYYEHERMLEGEPVIATVRVRGKKAGSLVHRDGEGWKRLVIPTVNTGPYSSSPARGEISVEVSTAQPRRRGFCWAATVRRGAGGERR